MSCGQKDALKIGKTQRERDSVQNIYVFLFQSSSTNVIAGIEKYREKERDERERVRKNEIGENWNHDPPTHNGTISPYCWVPYAYTVLLCLCSPTVHAKQRSADFGAKDRAKRERKREIRNFNLNMKGGDDGMGAFSSTFLSVSIWEDAAYSWKKEIIWQIEIWFKVSNKYTHIFLMSN